MFVPRFVLGNSYRFEWEKRSFGNFPSRERSLVLVCREIDGTIALSKERFLNSFHSFLVLGDQRLRSKQKIHCFHCGGGELRTASGEIPRIYLLTPDVRGIICLATRLRLLLI